MIIIIIKRQLLELNIKNILDKTFKGWEIHAESGKSSEKYILYVFKEININSIFIKLTIIRIQIFIDLNIYYFLYFI